MITVYYDGKCGLCSKEIKYYQKIAPDNTFVWIDILANKAYLKAQGIDTVAALKLLHAQDDSGCIHIGIDAFILIWKNLKGWRVLAKICSFMLIKKILQVVYKAFAEWRFARLEHCQCELKSSDKNSSGS